MKCKSCGDIAPPLTPELGYWQSSCQQEMMIPLTKEEIEDVLSNLEQCKCEGYLDYGDPAFTAMEKLKAFVKDENGPTT